MSTRIASRLLDNMLKNQASILFRSRGISYSGRIHTAILRSSSYVRNFSQEPLNPGVDRLWTTETIVTELRKANVRCTSSGIKALDAAYAYASASPQIPYGRSYILWYQLNLIRTGPVDVETPDALHEDDLNPDGSGARQWRSWKLCDTYIDGKVYKLWEALYIHSKTFKELIDQEEEQLYWRHQGYDDIQCVDLWRWMHGMIAEGFVERVDIDKLPETLLQDIVPGSGHQSGGVP